MEIKPSDWTSGYVADIGYTFGYYPELNPLRIKLAFLNSGVVYPAIKTACELGFGQGVSTNIHAAASNIDWYGTDFNPSQAGFAQEMGLASGVKTRLYDDSFHDFVRRPDLPDFDYIGLHGIWSWISDENRQIIVELIRKKLKVGGVVYVSYNTLPGWAAFAPMRHLMTEHAEVLGSEGGGIVSRIDGAMDFAEKLLATNPLYSRANPLVGDRLTKMKEHNRHYLAHEYFNRDWHPMHFATMAEWLSGAKMQYTCSANYLDAIDAINLTEQQQSFLREIPDPMFRESVRDFCVNQQFRKDFWVKGRRTLSILERAEELRALKVILISPAGEIPLKVTGALGEAEMSESIYRPILDFLADHQARTLGEIEKTVAGKGIALAQVVQAALVLSGGGHIATAQDDKVVAHARTQTDKLNNYLMNQARGSGDVGYLASPVSGGAVSVNRFQQLFLQKYKQGNRNVEDWAKYAWSILSQQGEKILKEGKALESEEENLAELRSQAKSFADKQTDILKGLQVI